MRSRSQFTFLSIACAVFLIGGCTEREEDETTIVVDVLLTGGSVFDGSGAEPYPADVGIRESKIAFIGDASARNVRASVVINVEGRWVTPGFIDAHSHAQLDEDYGRDALPYLHQGISTVVLGLDGAGGPNVAERLQLWEDDGIGVNGLLFVGHGAVRNNVMGHENREPTDVEMAAMQALVLQGMDEGAFGLSSGLFYVPGSYASTDEVIELGRIAARFDGAIYDTHDRDLGAVYEGIGYDASVEEGIRIGEEAGMRTIFSHYNLQGAHNYGRGDDGARHINDARERGVDVWAAHHPYTATQSNLRSYTIPDWAAAGGHEQMVARFSSATDAEQIVTETNAMLDIRGGAENILFVDPRPDLNGRTLAEVAAEQELAPAEAVQKILRDGNVGVMNLKLYDMANTRRLAQEPWMMTCTDGRTPRPDQPITHPRTFGAFPMKMRMFVFEESLLTPEFVIRSFSGLAADFYRLPDRGYIRENYNADIAVIDPRRYRDRATIDDPRQLSEGVEHMLVNGTFAIRDGAATGALAGRPLRRPQ